MIRLIVPGEPQAKGRPRFYPIRTKTGRTFSRAVTPERTRSYEVYIRELFVVNFPNFVPMEGPLSLTVDAYLGIPKSTSRKRREGMEGGFIVPEKRPDADNILKSAGDALNGLAFRDDSQIAEAIIRKRFSSQPRMIIRVGPVGEGKP
jgi:Holliday junction resolvase RusA-like endonuclease